MREQFIEIFNEHVKREGASQLLSWLQRTDFFTAPASTRFHLAQEGGLCLHSLNVYRRLCQNPQAAAEYSPETLAVCGLLHDICKADFYAVSTRNVKNEQTGQWEKQPFYTVNDQLPYGHGEKSVYIISGFMRLSREEAMAIRWHMGGFDDSVKVGSFALSGAFERYPLAVHLHVADLQATYLDEVRKDKFER
ncbi:HD domain-containing protein [Harryflintia acetispora]|uniref:HD domain-containing protein n=1 Tax=Harryflintia acetispora TaxID=1849041 RepID=A0A9X8UIG3_9FIRM|nr:HD domain-containing protein [Harryflintia acetispora]TCL42810.1 hypothetical protein EDD78_108123 [Harryflintia acetispora]